MVTNHFKSSDEETRKEIASMLIHGEPGSSVCVNHACLIGYDFKAYEDLEKGAAPIKLLSEFANHLLEDGERLRNLLQSNFDKFDRKHLKFEVFFIPFPSVSEFRNAFNAALD